MNQKPIFQSKWFEKCIRNYFNLTKNEPIPQNLLHTITYLYIETTNCYRIAFGTGTLPKQFYFKDAGDEWECCCISNLKRYTSLDDFIKVIDWNNSYKILTLKKEILEEIEENTCLEEINETEMEQFYSSIKYYNAKAEDLEELTEQENTCDYGILSSEDFAQLKGLEVIRFMDCETELHRLTFLKELSNLKILELGEIRLETMEGTEQLLNLEILCLWPDFYY